MKLTDMPLSSRGKEITVTGEIASITASDNGYIDVVLSTTAGGMIRISVDPKAVDTYDFTVNDPTTTPASVPASPAQ